MKKIKQWQIMGVFSFGAKQEQILPDQIYWAVTYGGDATSSGFVVDAIPQSVLEHCLEIAEFGWTGWSFETESRRPLLLFENQQDALVAELLYSTCES